MLPKRSRMRGIIKRAIMAPKEAIEKTNPTKLLSIKSERKDELIYAAKAMWKLANKTARYVLRLVLFKIASVIANYYTSIKTGRIIGRL